VQIDRSSIGSAFIKYATGDISQSVVTNLMLDGGTSTGSFPIITYNDVLHTNVQVKGNAQVIKSGVRQQSSSTLANLRVIGPSVGVVFPQIAVDDQHIFGVTRTVCSTTSGSSILTIPSGPKTGNSFAVGVPITGPGIPTDTFVGESQDLTATQVRLVDKNGANVNATQTRSSIFLTTRRGVYQDGLTQNNIVNNRNINNIQYTPLTAGNWPSNAPFNASQALDVLASRLLIKETVALTGTDITNQYVDLSNTYLSGSLDVKLRTAATPLVVTNGHEGSSYEYTLTTYMDANGITKTRLTFVTNWATGGGTALVAGDTLHIQGLTQADNF
jgi:hypothetical protein